MPEHYTKGSIRELPVGHLVTLKNGAVAKVVSTSGKRLQIVKGPKK